jgi:NIPSNAP
VHAKSIDRHAAGRESAPIAVKPSGHSREERVLIDHRTYRILPGRVSAQLDLYGKLAYPVQLRYMGEPHYYLVAESGELNTLVHGWVYDSAADREAKRAKMMQDPDWKHFLAENAKAGNVIDQRNSLMVPAPFAPKINKR